MEKATVKDKRESVEQYKSFKGGLLMLSYYETCEAIKRGINDIIEQAWAEIDSVLKRDGEAKLPIMITLSATGPGGQVDVITAINLVTNEDEKPLPFKPERIKKEKRIRLNPAQKPLPGQE